MTRFDKFDKFDKYVKMQIWKQECKQANLGGWVLGGRSKQVLVTPGGAATLCALHCTVQHHPNRRCSTVCNCTATLPLEGVQCAPLLHGTLPSLQLCSNFFYLFTYLGLRLDLL